MERTTTSPELRPDPDLHVESLLAPQLLGIPADGVLHRQGRVAGPHRVVLVRQRRAEERHDPVAQHLVHRALVAVDGLHQPFQDGVEQTPRLLRIAVSQELHRPLQVREQHRDLLALALDRLAGVEDLLDEMDGRVRERVALVVAVGHPMPSRIRPVHTSTLPSSSAATRCASISSALRSSR